MILAIAGKSNALIECLNWSLNFFNKENVFVIPSESDEIDDTWQYSVKKYCFKKGFSVCELSYLYEIENLIFVSIQYDRIIDVSKFKSKRLYNIHFSYLPYYKGMYPIIWPILNQSEFSGVTLHRLDWGIDTGDIIDQEKIKLDNEITARVLYDACLGLAFLLFKRNLKKIIHSSYSTKRQSELLGSYYSKRSIDFSSLKIDFNKTASEVSSQFRAFIFPEYQYPVYKNFEIGKVEITKNRSFKKPGTVLEETDSYFIVSTIDFNVKIFKSFNNKLFLAIQSNKLEEVKKVVSLVDNFEVKNQNGWTALMMASYKGRIDMVKILVERGADVNAKNFKGTSVLMYAKSSVIKSNSLELLEYLINQGARVDDFDNEGISLIEYAEREGNDNIIKYLKSKVNINQ